MKHNLRDHPAAQAGRGVFLRLADESARWTAPLRMHPDFLIVGAQRCGTTSMFKTLLQHPDVARPFLRKGVHYFDKEYERGPDWYRGHFPLVGTARLRRLGRRTVVTGESSPYYMFHPLAAQRVARDLRGVRLIVMLRDPVERAYSAHSHERARGFETVDFPTAIQLEQERLSGEQERMLADPTYDSHAWQHQAYLRRGVYIEQLKRLESLFGRERLTVVDSQEFFDDPAPQFREVLTHLGLRPAPVRFEQHNARSRSPMASGLRKRLAEHFAPHNEELARWWGRTPSWCR